MHLVLSFLFDLNGFVIGDETIVALSGHTSESSAIRHNGTARKNRIHKRRKINGNNSVRTEKIQNKNVEKQPLHIFALRPRSATPQGGKASWRSGYAADCKSVYTSSILVLASISPLFRWQIFSTPTIAPQKMRYTLVTHFLCRAPRSKRVVST